MNLHVAAFGELSDEQKSMITRAQKIREEERKLYDEIQTISRELRTQGINLWEEINKAK